MNTRHVLLALGFLLLAAGTVQAQDRQRPTRNPREIARARREAVAQNRDAMEHRREAMRLRLENMPAEQREFLQALRAERIGVIGQVKAGTLSRQEAREAIRAWVQANRPARPTR